MDQVVDQEPEIAWDGQPPVWELPPVELGVESIPQSRPQRGQNGMVCEAC